MRPVIRAGASHRLLLRSLAAAEVALPRFRGMVGARASRCRRPRPYDIVCDIDPHSVWETRRKVRKTAPVMSLTTALYLFPSSTVGEAWYHNASTGGPL